MRQFIVAYTDGVDTAIKRARIVADSEESACINFSAFCEVAPKQVLYCVEVCDTHGTKDHIKCWSKFGRT
jgi:hypothetical protein